MAAVKCVFRILLASAMVASLLLCGAALVLWIMTYFGQIHSSRGWIVQVQGWAHTRFVSMSAGRGGLEVAAGSNWYSKEFVDKGGLWRVMMNFPWSYRLGEKTIYPSDTFANLAGIRHYAKGGGFAWVQLEAAPPGKYTAPRLGTDGHIIVLPLWFLTLTFGAWPAMASVRWRRRRREARKGLCPRCGYDLRASPDRCPECGNVPESLAPG
jgi:hypothetical protein